LLKICKKVFKTKREKFKGRVQAKEKSALDLALEKPDLELRSLLQVDHHTLAKAFGQRFSNAALMKWLREGDRWSKMGVELLKILVDDTNATESNTRPSPQLAASAILQSAAGDELLRQEGAMKLLLGYAGSGAYNGYVPFVWCATVRGVLQKRVSSHQRSSHTIVRRLDQLAMLKQLWHAPVRELLVEVAHMKHQQLLKQPTPTDQGHLVTLVSAVVAQMAGLATSFHTKRTPVLAQYEGSAVRVTLNCCHPTYLTHHDFSFCFL
jgi:hypothetical protein